MNITKRDGVKEPAMSEFKIGNKIIRLDNNSPHIYSIQKIEDGLATIVRKVRHKTWGAWLLQNEIRLATQEEIAAGHRIDNDMGEDFPIENHISPNCKVEDV